MTNVSTNSSDLYETARQVSFVYLVMVGTLGIIGNSLVILVFINYRKLRTAANVFILNLALCDLIISVLDTSFSVASSHKMRWMFGKFGCLCYGFLHYFVISITVSTLAAISVDRFFYITKPVQAKAWRITKTRAIVMLIIIYVYVLLFTFPPLAGWSSFIVEEHFFSGCYIHYGDQDPASIGYSVIASFFLFLVPLIVMIFCYSRIFSAVRLSTQKTISKTLKTSTSGTTRRKYPLLKRTHVQTAKMIVVVIFFCVIVWMPYVVVSLIKAFTGNALPLASHMTVLIAKSCVIYNILIYVILNRKLKASVVNFICCGKVTDFSGASVSKHSVSKVKTEKDITSEAVRNRLSAITAVLEANENGLCPDKPSPMLLKNNSFRNHYVGLGSYPVGLDNHEDQNGKRVDFSNKPSSRGRSDCDNRVGGEKGNSRDIFHQFRLTGHLGDNNESHDIKSLSFAGLQGNAKYNNPHQANEITKCETKRRAQRKMNGIYGKDRKILPKKPSKCERSGPQNYRNNNNESNRNISGVPSENLFVRQNRENSSSNAIPSSAKNTLGEGSITNIQGDDSTENSSICYAAIHKSNSRKSKTIGYQKRRTSPDLFNVSPSELHDIQNYWKRMSLCLDDINFDEGIL